MKIQEVTKQMAFSWYSRIYTFAVIFVEVAVWFTTVPQVHIVNIFQAEMGK